MYGMILSCYLGTPVCSVRWVSRLWSENFHTDSSSPRHTSYG